MSKFKIGDRVKNININGPMYRANEEGVVIGISDAILVEYDNYISGHDGNNDQYKGKPGHCWWELEENLKLTSITEQQLIDLQKNFANQMGAIGKLITKNQSDKLIKEKEEELEEQIYELSNDLKVADDLISSKNTEIEELKARYNKAIFNLTDSVNEKEDLLDYADKQLDDMARQIAKKDTVIRELSELIIKLTNSQEG